MIFWSISFLKKYWHWKQHLEQIDLENPFSRNYSILSTWHLPAWLFLPISVQSARPKANPKHPPAVSLLLVHLARWSQPEAKGPIWISMSLQISYDSEIMRFVAGYSHMGVNGNTLENLETWWEHTLAQESGENEDPGPAHMTWWQPPITKTSLPYFRKKLTFPIHWTAWFAQSTAGRSVDEFFKLLG